MTSRERLQAAIEHRQPDRVPVDFGSTAVTGMHVSIVHRLRQRLLGEPGYRVKVIEPYQMLGEIDDALREVLGIDVVGVPGRKSILGTQAKDWKPFTLFDGTPCEVSGDFNVKPAPDGGWHIYPEGDTSAPPCGHMPEGGHFFDTIVRQDPIDEDRLDPADNCEEFAPLGADDLAYYRDRARWCGERGGLGTILSVPGTAFGDIALVPAPFLKHPRGIRDVAEWYISTKTRRAYVTQVFERQCEVALANLATLTELLGDRIQIAFVTGTDFGTQRGPFISVETYRNLFQPFHRQVNDFIHRRSAWKTFIHSCGSVYQLIPEFIEAGFDVLNPVQCSAAEMGAERLKREFGRDLVLWGGGVDTQKTLAFGTPQDVYREVRERVDLFNRDGGFVFNAVHNIQANTPIDNVMALFNALRDAGAA
ncbi:MAG: methyltransferase [Verrucomicrobia bacterium]|jgi:uroporphyrinogen-III decarboxylase|nr:methyltransferase [Verrucomicrobiota bacterium]OQC65471.1 MAG: methylcobalamin:coenzyme M methyltransferase [Verrucomicrobia bacterium ADurb.Bin006]MDI9380373.1 uroporphyrinogen decarboxylase family protein [Verrucomicrobiota bacterium]NMD19942.1 methyltransferase [Verrucomicrobiota bacterium]HNU98441.1 uroporphyrinogen decarboxylase family protein [Verrucomicrobiota bacterium]